eukprot:GFKZ01004426.1.p1 GENE.GFKZ01004426.1~~GFKZ01004426.1.p1  ORF type:complete len:404 (+),score=62.10 GFKZ01004426.1:89-1213(+)
MRTATMPLAFLSPFIPKPCPFRQPTSRSAVTPILPLHVSRSTACAAAPNITTPTAPPPAPTSPIDSQSTDALIHRLSDLLPSTTPIPDATLNAMVDHLADSRGMSRLSLVESFGVIGSPAVPTLLSALSTNPNPVIRRSCAKALAKIGDPRATQALLHALVYDDDTVVRSSSAGALARMGTQAVAPLLELISDDHVNMTAKGHAAWAISFMQGDAGDALFESLRHPNQDVRIAVVSALGAVAMGDALPMMGGNSDDDWVEDEGERAGKGDMRQRAVGAMRAALADDSAEVRAEAVTALANAGCVDEAYRIVAMLADANVELRRCAALALMKLGVVAVVPRLRDVQRDDTEDPGVRSVAKLAADCLEREDDDGWD